jgi:NAD+--asparagine ADP-ribosyltransferase
LEQSKNSRGRELMKNKTNLNENFNVKLAGYSGHKPMSFVNEKGNPRPNLFSTMGETFF